MVPRRVDEEGIGSYFAAVSLAGSPAVAAGELGTAFGISVLTTVSTVLLFGSALVVGGTILLVAVGELRVDRRTAWWRVVMP